MSPALWAVLVVGVDVGHVYSTLWRTYFDRAEFARRRTLYVLAPLLGWLAFACLYSLGPMVFWRALAYLAVFHFVRQQYGFMMIYARRERRHARIDKAAIYAATLYPLIVVAHASAQLLLVRGRRLRERGGARAGGRWRWPPTAPSWRCTPSRNARMLRAGRPFNWPRNLLLAVTALSWWVGIVALDSDLAFTMINVVAHGVPYVALIWWTGRVRGAGGRPARLFTAAWAPVFVAIPLLLAYAEEGLWDGLIWLDHPGLFPAFRALPAVDDPGILVWLTPLLALPQITHYILDAFIWRRGAAGPEWAGQA